MILCRTIDELKEQQTKMWSGGSKPRIGFVPTMGYLHEGHASLMRQAAAENDITVLSIFVNPLQFGPNEDFETYPRNEQRDLSIAAENGVDLVFMPSVSEMYPRKVLTKVLVSDVTDRLCGASRPGHFDGVGTVVSKLFHLVQPDRAYFGMKDAQQVAVIQQMTDDLNFPVTIVPCPIVREPDGLALSSRNVYLNAEQRAQAVVLSSSLAKAREWMKDASLTPAALVNKVRAAISEAPLANIDYVEVLEYPALATPEAEAPFHRTQQRYILALAVKFGATRLIDNELFEPVEVNGNV